MDLDRADTQPTRARWEVVLDSADKRRALGGSKTGNNAWGLAWVDTTMELTSPISPNLPEEAQISPDSMLIDLT